MTRLAHAALLTFAAASLVTACSSGPAESPQTSRSPSSSQKAAGSQSATPTVEPSRPNAPQQAQLTMHPQIAQPGNRPAHADAALSAMTASFRPVRPGREVELSQKRGGAWETVDTGLQDRRGAVEFSAPYGSANAAHVYRVTAVANEELPEEVSAPARTDRWGQPTFDDGFEGDALGASWSHRLQGYSEESSRACSRADPRAARVSDGFVRLSTLVDPDRQGESCGTDEGPFDYRLNGHISTEAGRSFTYGTFAARIRFQDLRGQHGAFWMQPLSQLATEGDPADTGAEIDVIEWFGEGQAQGGLTSFVYYRPDADGEQVGGFIKNPGQYGDDWGDRFHVFSVEWTPDAYVFRIDGQETFRTSEGVSGRPQFMILSLLSSDYELPFIEEEDLPQHMDVDWVRHWQN